MGGSSRPRLGRYLAAEPPRAQTQRRDPAMTSRIPTYEADLFDDDALREPYDHYRALRSLGPVVWLQRPAGYAVPRYDEVRHALNKASTFCSGQGVGLNEFINVGGRGTTLMSDGEAHDRQR